MTRRTLALVLATAIITVACGGSDEPATTTSPVPATSDSAAPPSTASTATADTAPGPTAGTTGAAPAPDTTEAAPAPSTTAPAPAVPTSISVTRLASFEPLFHPVSADSNHYMTLYLIFDPLVKVDFRDSTLQTLIPALAERWEAEGSTVYTLYLREGVTWQDGTPFTAEDVVYTATWGAQNQDRFLGFKSIWGQLKGAADAKGTTNPVAGVEALDEFTVRFTLENPNSEFLRGLADAPNVIVPEHLLQSIAAEAVENSDFTTRSPIGTGPYRLEKVEPGQFVEFVANADYYAGSPKINRVFFKILSADAAYPQLEAGELDLVVTIPITEFDRLAANPNLNVQAVQDAGSMWLFTTDEKPPLDNKLVRQALYYAIPRQQIVDSLLDGRARVLIGPPGFREYPDLDRYEFNPERARELLAEANFDFSRPLKIPYISDNPLYGSLVPAIAQFIEDVGIEVELNPMDIAAYRAVLGERPRDNWDAIVVCCNNEALSPLLSQGLYLAGDEPVGATGYYSDELRAMFESARSAGSEAERERILHDIAVFLNTELPLIYLWSPQNAAASSKRLGGGFGVIPVFDRFTFMHIHTWEVSE